MKQYAVTLPVAGSITVFVEAETDEQAIELAFEQQDWRVESGENTEPGEFETLMRINSGNCCHAPCWEASAEAEEESA